MKKVVIVEDEAVAAQRLTKLLAEADAEIQVAQVLQTIEDSVEWFSDNPAPDLVFMDIQLSDGISFRIFDKVRITCPIIFTTAYDQYALDAFKVNSIDYLLKPIAKEDLHRALNKYERLSVNQSPKDNEQITELIKLFSHQNQQFQSYFLIPVKDKLVPLAIADVACFYLEDKVSRALTLDGRTIILGKPLDTIEEQLDPQLFFRANRQFVVAHKAIRSISVWFGGKLQITLSVPTPDRIIISKTRAAEFKNWFTK